MSVTISEGQPRAFKFVSAVPLLYLGEADVGSPTSSPVWRIYRIDVTVGAIILFADGNHEFDNIFDNYATLDYR